MNSYEYLLNEWFEAQKQAEAARVALFEQMQADGVKKAAAVIEFYDSSLRLVRENVTATMCAASADKTGVFDSKRLQAEKPEIYAEFCTGTRKGSAAHVRLEHKAAC